MDIWKYFKNSILFSFFGLGLGALLGYYYQPNLEGALEALFIVLVLSVLEISISFDNAVVNASILQKMTKLWQHRFLTWGIWIAVFGMRLVFPLLIVGVMAHLNPWEALRLAALEPKKYAEIMNGVHIQISSFGGAFLLLISLKYFLNDKKNIHWIRFIEKPLSKLGHLEAIEIGLTLILLTVLSRFFSNEEGMKLLLSGIAGIICYLIVEGISTILEKSDMSSSSTSTSEKLTSDKTTKTKALPNIHKASIGMFIYLEVLDASFSFDGVIGAFAITNNLFIIAIGLAIGAFFVRSLTILIVDKGTLNTFKFLEHGAFYAVVSLACIMFLNTIISISEVITGFIGVTFIGLSLLSSYKQNFKEKQ